MCHHRSNRFAVRLIILSCGLASLQACREQSRNSAAVVKELTVTASSTEQSTTQPVPVPRVVMGGPKIFADSSATIPRLVVEGDTNVLHLPVGMAQVIADSLPDFSPLPLSMWTPATVATIASEGHGAALPSVVLGDFNGDEKMDVALQGNSRQNGVIFFPACALGQRARFAHLVHWPWPA